MNKTTADKIKAAALYLEELLGWEAELLKVHEFVAEPSHKKKLKAAIAFIAKGTPPNLEPALQTGYEVLKALQAAALTNEEVAAKTGKTPETVKQTIAALKAGGIVFVETSTGKYQVTGSPRKVRRAQS